VTKQQDEMMREQSEAMKHGGSKTRQRGKQDNKATKQVRHEGKK
jgi:hypothetical protein